MSTETKPKRGRPALPRTELRAAMIPVRVQLVERAAYERAAKRAGLGLSEWIRQTLNAAAGR